MLNADELAVFLTFPRSTQKELVRGWPASLFSPQRSLRDGDGEDSTADSIALLLERALMALTM